jgi:hypothetical protein
MTAKQRAPPIQSLYFESVFISSPQWLYVSVPWSDIPLQLENALSISRHYISSQGWTWRDCESMKFRPEQERLARQAD